MSYRDELPFWAIMYGDIIRVGDDWCEVLEINPLNDDGYHKVLLSFNGTTDYYMFLPDELVEVPLD